MTYLPKKRMITLPTGKVVEDWTTDWLDSDLSVLYLLHDGTTYKPSYEILPKHKVIESFVVESNRIDFDEIYKSTNICKTHKAADKMFIKCCQHHNYFGYPFYYGIDKYLEGDTKVSNLPAPNELPNIDKLLHWKRVNYSTHEMHLNEPLSRYNIIQIETFASEWINYRVINLDDTNEIPESIIHSLDDSILTSFAHCLVESFFFAWHVEESFRSYTMKRIFNVTRKYLNKNDLTRIDANKLTPLELFNVYFPFVQYEHEVKQKPEWIEFRNLLTHN